MSDNHDRNGRSHEDRKSWLDMADHAVPPDMSAAEAGETSDDRAADALIESGLTAPEARAAVRIVKLHLAPTRGADCEDVMVLFETLRNVIDHIEAAGENAAREAQLHRFAFDFRQTSSESMRKAAVRWGVSVEAISKSVAAIRRRHNLALNSFNKSAESAERYRESNRHRRAAEDA